MKTMKEIIILLLTVAVISSNAQSLTSKPEQVQTSHADTSQITSLTGLETLFSYYFELKNAFIQADIKNISIQAMELSKQFELMDMSKLNQEQYQLLVKLKQDLINTSDEISKSNKIDRQRTKFNQLSHGFYKIAKIADLHYESYWQHCPMFNKGADWLSREQQIKNPYYGNDMLTCGNTTETIK